MKYCVTVARTGCIFVEAENESEAIDIANHQDTDREHSSRIDRR